MTSFSLDYLSLLAWNGKVVNDNLHGGAYKYPYIE